MTRLSSQTPFCCSQASTPSTCRKGCRSSSRPLFSIYLLSWTHSRRCAAQRGLDTRRARVADAHNTHTIHTQHAHNTHRTRTEHAHNTHTTSTHTHTTRAEDAHNTHTHTARFSFLMRVTPLPCSCFHLSLVPVYSSPLFL
jgi:ABC-type nickel/cobalt efflux system permease component RcnA